MVQAGIIVAVFIMGMMGGGVLAWLFLRTRMLHVEDRVRSGIDAELIMTRERLRAAEEQAAGLKETLDRSYQSLDKQRTELAAESERRATAEALAARIPEIEVQVRDREDRISALLNEQAGLKTQLAALDTRLQEERKAAEAKLVLLNDAQNKLSDAF